MNALIYCPSGCGKTVNAVRVRTGNRGRNLLVCTDNSSIVLKNFPHEELDIVNVSTVKEFTEAYQNGYKSGKYDNIILDNVSDLIDMWLLELDESKAFKDFRQAYSLVYQSIKRLSRESTALDCNTIFTAWQDSVEITLPKGEIVQRTQPKIPAKILDNFCGLMNLVGNVRTADREIKKATETERAEYKREWYYVLEGTATLMAKDQIACRKSCMPEDIFGIEKE